MNGFRFEKQAPAERIPFSSFVVRNKCLIRQTEPAMISFVDTDLYSDRNISFVNVVFEMHNPEFTYQHFTLSMIGKLRNWEFEDGSIDQQYTIKNNDKVTYGFIRSLLIANGLMDKDCYDAITTSKRFLKKYLTGKIIVFDGEMMRNGLLKVVY